MLFNFLQLENIRPIEMTFDVSKLDKSKDSKEMQSKKKIFH